MSGHRHNASAATQNQGNSLGDRSCVRQSKYYRMYESGNGVKSILGSSHLCWDPNVQQGAYSGQKVYDFDRDGYATSNNYGRNESDYSTKSNKDNYNRSQNDYYSGSRGNNSGNDYQSRNNSRNGSNYGNYDSSDAYPAEYQYQQRRDNRSMNDENVYNNRARNEERNERYPSEHENYPLSKMRSDDRSYRNAPEQANSLASFQSQRVRSSEKAAERAARSYFQPQTQERSTRPW